MRRGGPAAQVEHRTTAGTRAGRGRGRVVAVGLTNYVLRRDTRPGAHRLRFSLETAHGFRVQRVDVRASSGLRPTAEPPYTIDLAISPAKVTTRPGAAAAFDVAVRNGGTVPARRVSLSVIESDAMVVDNRSALEDWPVIRPKRVVRRRVRLLPRTPGAWLVDVAVDSSKGTDVETLRLVAERKTAVGGDGHSPSRIAIGAWLAVIVALFASRCGCGRPGDPPPAIDTTAMARRGIALVVVVLALLGVGAVLLVGSGDETEYDPARVGQSLARATKVRSYYPCSDQGEAIVCEMRGPSLARYRVSRTKDACWRARVSERLHRPRIRLAEPDRGLRARQRRRLSRAPVRLTRAGGGGRVGARPPPADVTALVRHPPLRERVGEDRRAVRLVLDALEAEAPEERVAGREPGPST